MGKGRGGSGVDKMTVGVVVWYVPALDTMYLQPTIPTAPAAPPATFCSAKTVAFRPALSPTKSEIHMLVPTLVPRSNARNST